MTWHKVIISLAGKSYIEGSMVLNRYEHWCLDNLSSEGVLWKITRVSHDHEYDFSFAQPQDAVMFRLRMGV